MTIPWNVTGTKDVKKGPCTCNNRWVDRADITNPFHASTCPLKSIKINIFSCKICCVEIKGFFLMQAHLVEMHGRDFLKQCSKCNEGVTDFKKFKYYHRTHGHCVKATFELCGKSMSRKLLEKHKSEVHENIFNWVCEFPGCHKKFKTKPQTSRHVALHTNINSYKCTACDKMFRVESTARKHMMETHGEDYQPYVNSKIQKVRNETHEEFESLYVVRIEPEKDAKPRYERSQKKYM